MQEAADLAVAMDTFGVSPSSGLLETMDPKTEEEFDKFREALCDKIVAYEVTLEPKFKTLQAHNLSLEGPISKLKQAFCTLLIGFSDGIFKLDFAF